jgi:UDP-N-acetylglucosamine/UDP-N-acetylgalactosamine 4-epimerase
MSKYIETKNHLKVTKYKWLITGAAGFIGSNLVQQLLNLNQEVVGFDNFATGYQANLNDALNEVDVKLRNNFTFIEADIRDLDSCRTAMRNVNFVLHQAALGSVPRSIEIPAVTNAVNVDGFLNMLIAAKDAGVKSFVYASSSSVYGDSPTLPKLETHTGNPLSPYAVSKYTNELYAKSFANCYGLKTIGLRYFNVFGARQDPNGAYAAVIPKWVDALLNAEDVCINGDGTTTRDFCYIDNVVQANILSALADNSDAFGEAYNIAYGSRIDLNQLFEYIKNTLGLDADIKPRYKDFRAGDIKHSLADISKARTLLGYSPDYNVKDGLNLAVDWYKDNLNAKN